MAISISKRNLIAILILFGYGSYGSVDYDFWKNFRYWMLHDEESFVIVKLIYFVIFLTSYFVASILVTRYGGASILGIATLLRGIFLLLTPLVRLLEIENTYFYVSELLTADILHKLAFCALPDIWSRWSPPEERFRRAAVVAFLSYPILFFRTDTIGQLIYENNMGKIVLCTSAIALLIWSVIWLIHVKNDPTSDNSLSSEEKKLLTEKVQIIDRKRNSVHTYPWKSILTSKPLWILCIVGMIHHVGEINFVRLTNNFMLMGQLTIIWFSISIVSLFVYGYAADLYKDKINIGKFYMCFGFLSSAIMMGLLQYAMRNESTSLLQLIGAIFFFLFIQSRVLFELVVLVTVMELSPRYSALLYGILNTFYQVAALITFNYFAHNQEDWRFYWYHVENYIDYRLMITIFGLGALIYCFWGSSKLQPWNRVQNEEYELTKREAEQNARMEAVA